MATHTAVNPAWGKKTDGSPELRGQLAMSYKFFERPFLKGIKHRAD